MYFAVEKDYGTLNHGKTLEELLDSIKADYDSSILEDGSLEFYVGTKIDVKYVSELKIVSPAKTVASKTTTKGK